MRLVLIAAAMAVAGSALADSPVNQGMNGAGQALGSFGAGVANVITKQMWDSQPHWVTVEPKSKDECMKASHGTIDSGFMRCRNGYQAQVIVTSSGEIHVIQERKIPN